MIRRSLLLATFLSTLAATARAADWPQWRGPKNDGHSPAQGLPTEWGPEKNVLWKFTLPGGKSARGSSTPCISGDRIFLTAMDGSQVVLLCIGTDGTQKWKRPLGTGRSGLGPGGQGDDASPSCSTDGKHVWAMAGNGAIGCYDFNGQPVWEFNLTEKYGPFTEKKVIQFGGHWTPVLHQGRLYLQIYHRAGQHLVALDAATGKEVWRIDRKGAGKGESPDTYASPFIWEGQGGPLLISHGNDYTTAHKLEDGAEVWRVTDLNPNNSAAWRFVSSPLLTPNLIVIPTCKNGPTVGLNPVGLKGTVGADHPAELWRLPSTTPDVPSPILVGDVVYLVGAGGEVIAVDARSGEVLHKHALAKQHYRASPVFADGKILVAGVEGTFSLLEPGRKFRVVATNKLPDTFYASPAIADGRIYLRGWGALWAIGTK